MKEAQSSIWWTCQATPSGRTMSTADSAATRVAEQAARDEGARLTVVGI
jgi:hypothetical protein